MANGGIATEQNDRRELKRETMRPFLALTDANGTLGGLIDLPVLRQNSIRHLADAPHGTLAFAMQ